MSSVGQGSIEKFGGRLRGAKRSSSSLAERVSESSDKHEVREGTVPVMCSNRSWANYLQRAGASDDQMAMCFTSRLEGGLPSMARRRSRGERAPKAESRHRRKRATKGGVCEVRTEFSRGHTEAMWSSSPRA